MSSKTLKYFGYLRKSSEDKEKQAFSIPTQREKLSERFADLDIEFIEESKSAFVADGRPLFAQMLNRIKNGEARGIIAWSPDRLSRNELDGAQISYLVRTRVIPDLRFCTSSFDNTPEGIMMLQMSLSQSQYESSKKGRDVRRGLEKKASMGIYPAPAPLGYRNDKYEERGKKKIYVDEDRFGLIRKMIDLMLTGNYTPPAILKIANDEWGFRTPDGKKMSRSTVYNIFSRPFYYGEFEYPVGSDKWHKGIHMPMISREEYDRLQLLLGRKGNPRPKSRHDMAYRGPVHCGECGALITAEEKLKKLAKGGVAHYTYYHCTKRKDPNCTQKSIEEKELEKQIISELQKLQIPKGFKEWALARLKEMNSKEITDREQMYSNQRKEYEGSVRRIDNLIDMRANGEIDEGEFRNRKARLLSEKDHFQSLLIDTDKRVDHWLDVAERGFDFAEKAATIFAQACEKNDIAVKKEIFMALGSNYVLKDRKLTISVDNLLFPILKGAENLRDAFPRLEPEEHRLNAGSTDASDPHSRSMLGD